MAPLFAERRPRPVACPAPRTTELRCSCVPDSRCFCVLSQTGGSFLEKASESLSEKQRFERDQLLWRKVKTCLTLLLSCSTCDKTKSASDLVQMAHGWNSTFAPISSAVFVSCLTVLSSFLCLGTWTELRTQLNRVIDCQKQNRRLKWQKILSSLCSVRVTCFHDKDKERWSRHEKENFDKTDQTLVLQYTTFPQ